MFETGSYDKREEKKQRKKQKRRVTAKSKGITIENYEDFFIDDVLRDVKKHKSLQKQ